MSWSTILNKCENYRRLVDSFDPQRVARFTPKRVEKLLADPGIVRNRLKVEGAVKNARAFLALQEERGTFDAYLWEFVNGEPIQGRWRTLRDIPATTPESDVLSKDLRRRGFRFVGSTIMYAVHAGSWHGERSHPGLFPAGRGRVHVPVEIRRNVI